MSFDSRKEASSSRHSSYEESKLSSLLRPIVPTTFESSSKSESPSLVSHPQLACAIGVMGVGLSAQRSLGCGARLGRGFGRRGEDRICRRGSGTRRCWRDLWGMQSHQVLDVTLATREHPTKDINNIAFQAILDLLKCSDTFERETKPLWNSLNWFVVVNFVIGKLLPFLLRLWGRAMSVVWIRSLQITM